MNLQARIRKLETRTDTEADPDELVIHVTHGLGAPVRQTVRLDDLPSVDEHTVRIEVTK